MDKISNRQLTLLRKLQRKKYRQEEQLFLVEGERAVQQVIENGILRIKHLFFDESQNLWTDSSWSRKTATISSALIEAGSFLEITDTDNPQGIVALCYLQDEARIESLLETDGVIVATDRLQDPGNLGTIIRTASWFGVQGLLLGKGTVDLFNPKVVRSTAGTTGVLPFMNVDLSQALQKFEEAGWQVLLLDASADAEDLRQIDPPGKTVLVIGNEANGIDEVLIQNSGYRKVKIQSPTQNTKVESLNASIALSIALYALS